MTRSDRIVVPYSPETKAEIASWALSLGFSSTSEYVRALIGQHMGHSDDRRLWADAPTDWAGGIGRKPRE